MGVKSALNGIAVTPAHVSAAQDLGRAPAALITHAQQQAQGLIITLREIVKDVPANDANVAALNELIEALA